MRIYLCRSVQEIVFLFSTFKNLTLKVGKIKEINVKNFLRLDFFWV